MKTFLVSYRHEGEEWIIRLPARDASDAQARLAKLPYAAVDGELMGEFPAAAGPLVIMAMALRNTFAQLGTTWGRST